MRQALSSVLLCVALLAGLCQPAAAEDAFGFEHYARQFDRASVETRVKAEIAKVIPQNVGMPPIDPAIIHVGDMTSAGGDNPAAIRVEAGPPQTVVAITPFKPALQPKDWAVELHLSDRRSRVIGTAGTFDDVRVQYSGNQHLTTFTGGGGLSDKQEDVTVEFGRWAVRGRTTESQAMGLNVPRPAILTGGPISLSTQNRSSEIGLSYAVGRDTRLGVAMETSDPAPGFLSQGNTLLASTTVSSQKYTVGVHQRLGKSFAIGLTGSVINISSQATVHGAMLRATSLYGEANRQLDNLHGQIDQIPGRVQDLVQNEFLDNRVEVEEQIDAALPTYLDQVLSRLPPGVPDAAREQARQQALAAWQNVVRPELVQHWEQWSDVVQAEAVNQTLAVLPGLHNRVEEARTELNRAIPEKITVSGTSQIRTVTAGVEWLLGRDVRLALNAQTGEFQTGPWKVPFYNGSASLEAKLNEHFRVKGILQATAPGVELSYTNKDHLGVQLYYQKAHPALEIATGRTADQWGLNIFTRW